MSEKLRTIRCRVHRRLPVDGLDLYGGRGFFAGRGESDGAKIPATRRATFLSFYIYGYLNRVRSSRRLEDGVSSQHRGPLAVADFETGLQDHRRFPARQSARRFAPCSASSYCCADASTCTAASCWRSTEPASRRFNNKDRNFTRSSLRRVHPPRRRVVGRATSSGSTRAMLEDGATGGGALRTKNLAEDCGAQRKARPLPS